MALYEYQCENKNEIHVREVYRTMVEGPQPGNCPTCGLPEHRIFHTSMLRFGDSFAGDDDFSRRIHLNGEAGKNGGLRNKTQGTTNINKLLRKYGKAGLPLEANMGIDRTKAWRGNKAPIKALEGVTAPYELQSSEARGTKLKDEPK